MRIVIEGAGEVGSHLAKKLSNEGNDITVIGDEARLSRLRSTADVVTICGKVSSIKTFKEAGVDKADLFIAVNPKVSQDVNVVSAILAKKLGCARACARIDDEEYICHENRYIFTDMGIDLMVYPEKSASEEIADLLKRSASTDSMDFARGKLRMSVFRLDDNSPLLDLDVKGFCKSLDNGDMQFRIAAISRGNKTIIPGADTKFKFNDLVFIISRREGLPALMDFLGKKDIEVDKVMILGGSTIGEMVAKSLSSRISNVKVIESDRARCLALSENTDDNVTVAFGDGRNSDFLLEENISDYDAFVAVTENDEENVLACIVAKRFGVPRTIAEVENVEYIRLAEEMGVDAVINKKLITVSKILKLTLSSKVRSIKYMNGTEAEVLEYITAPDSLITQDTLTNIGFPKNAIVGGVIRGSESFIPAGDTQIEAYDRVVVFAIPEAVSEVDRFFKTTH